MSNTGDVSIQINKDVITPILEAKVKAAMVEALGSTGALTEQIVEHVLLKKVNADGKVDSYSSRNTYSWVDVVLKKTLEAAAREVMAEYVEDQKQALKEEMIRQLNTKRGISGFVKELLDGVTSSVKSNWTFKSEFKFTETD